ncbi:hypothetical protein C8R48DRAFT_759976 [Suillus tomentosus]|nr:hypothetical protein C8R48DRAFT_759976 [Suillus tomentosus]
MLVLHDLQCNDVRLIIGYPKVSLMVSYQIAPIPPHETIITPQYRQAARFLVIYFTATAAPLRGRSGEGTELQGRSPAVKVPHAKGKRRNASAREVAFAKKKQKQKTKPSHSKISTAGSPQPPKPNITKPSSQLRTAGSSLSTTPAAGDATAATIPTTSSRPHATIRDVGLWTRFWLFIGCISPEYTDGNH